jgi:hypothetical protein
MLDENDPGAVAVRPAHRADGSLDYWFANRDIPGGVAGTTYDQDYQNDVLGLFRDLFTQTGIPRVKGPAGDGALFSAIGSVIDLHGAVPQRGIIGMEIAPNADARWWDINSGVARDASNTRNILFGAKTKRSNEAFALGTNAGGYGDSVAIAPNQFYRVFALLHTDGIQNDCGIDQHPTAVNLLALAQAIDAGWTRFRQIGWVLTDGSNNLVPWMQDPRFPDEFYWHTAKIPVVTGAAFSTTLAQIPSYGAPPETIAKLNVRIDLTGATGAGIQTVQLGSRDWGTNPPVIDACSLYSFASTNAGTSVVEVPTSSFISPTDTGYFDVRTNTNAPGATYDIDCFGYRFVRRDNT